MATAPPHNPAPTLDSEESWTMARIPNTAISTPSSICATPRKRKAFSLEDASPLKLPLRVEERVFRVDEKDSAGDLTTTASRGRATLDGLESVATGWSDPPLIVATFCTQLVASERLLSKTAANCH
jgi:hypothetical protein